ncbi:tRNA pseudouridine(13) synthase TruD [Ketobacter sp. MCCC 1A13808]|uniref:tRNA pseudouridine(13) synthase TruD n=1 Tax=Ketobacter sp. MCCC 1A13808 TaxID=2602738 RepID=UPI0012EC1BD8|nr:tRNA pseudouridine(13) synthase TruD [Ketobacter sp. MCCC 1A13808]MVF12775.1 tRNA pseudouridine(13) synthase TruD [Ketobacter sp. MCCC 1A13808]
MTVMHQALPAYGFESAPYAHGEPLARADFKTRPEDFVVEEVLGFEPGGEGEHLFLLVQTDAHNTRHTQRCLARHFNVAKQAVSYSGMKDRRGLTSQWFSIHLPGKAIEPDADELAQQGFNVLRWQRHNKKLRIGTHKYNRFHIVLRNLSQIERLNSRLPELKNLGVPNYFGAQRFGHGGANIEEALQWVEQGKLPADRLLRSRVLSTLRGWLFNGVLADRVANGTWNQWQDQDLIQLNGTQSFFTEPQWDDQLQQRFLSDDIHLSAYLAGCDQAGTIPDQMLLLFNQARMEAEPRPLRLKAQQLRWNGDANALQIQFNLQKGAYATSVLRELVLLNDRSGQQEQI